MSSVLNTGFNQNKDIWQLPLMSWGLILLSMLLMWAIFYDGVMLMIDWWLTREEYGHGIMIPFITAFLIWQKKDKLEAMPFTESWLGLIVVIVGVLLSFLGEISSIYIVIQYAFLITILGVALTLMGLKSFKAVMIPFFILVFMLPLPNFLFNDLSSQLQLISSEIGVMFIRMFDISVYLEGNVIDLGVYKLQVVEACSGLNYLFPLMTLGFIAAYFFTGSFWKKAVIFLSAIPITIFMNSFRIGLIGVTVEYWGSSMAEGILHDFQGWVIFMSCTMILILEMWVLSKIGKNKIPLKEAFGLDFPEPTPKGALISNHKINKSFVLAVIVLIASVLISQIIDKRVEIIPDRMTYKQFPLEIDGWQGKHEILEDKYIKKLKLTDYALINYTMSDQIPINFYSAYYSSQRKESTTHSPRSCIPGGGWEITNTEKIMLNGISISSKPLYVNRLVIEKNEVKQLVYYWFKQRNRLITNEQMIKWYFFIDSLKIQRTDGALIRLTTIVPKGESLELADEKLTLFIKKISSIITDYVPD